MDELDIVVDRDGTVQFVYSDELAAVFDGETLHTRRASHVEPHPTRNGWVADMRPVGGPILGEPTSGPHLLAVIRADELRDGETIEDAWPVLNDLAPFKTRQAALDAERAWLRSHLGV